MVSALHDPPIRRAIEDEVRGPDLVATLGALPGAGGRLSGSSCVDGASTGAGLRVQAIDPFVIDDVAGTAAASDRSSRPHSVDVAAPGQRSDPGRPHCHRALARTGRLTRSIRPTARALRSLRPRATISRTTSRLNPVRSPFFCSTSRVTLRSRAAIPPQSFLSRPFSVSDALFRRFAVRVRSSRRTCSARGSRLASETRAGGTGPTTCPPALEATGG